MFGSVKKSLNNFWDSLKENKNGARRGLIGLLLGGVMTPFILGGTVWMLSLWLPTYVNVAVYVVHTVMEALGEGMFGEGTRLASLFGQVFGVYVPYGIVVGGMAVAVGMNVSATMEPNARELIEQGYISDRNEKGAATGFVKPGSADLNTEEGRHADPVAYALHEEYLKAIDEAEAEGKPLTSDKKKATLDALVAQYCNPMAGGVALTKQLQGLLMGAGLVIVAPLMLEWAAGALGMSMWGVAKGLMLVMAPFMGLSGYNEWAAESMPLAAPAPRKPKIVKPSTQKEASPDPKADNEPVVAPAAVAANPAVTPAMNAGVGSAAPEQVPQVEQPVPVPVAPASAPAPN